MESVIKILELQKMQKANMSWTASGSLNDCPTGSCFHTWSLLWFCLGRLWSLLVVQPCWWSYVNEGE